MYDATMFMRGFRFFYYFATMTIRAWIGDGTHANKHG